MLHAQCRLRLPDSASLSFAGHSSLTSESALAATPGTAVRRLRVDAASVALRVRLRVSLGQARLQPTGPLKAAAARGCNGDPQCRSGESGQVRSGQVR